MRRIWPALVAVAALAAPLKAENIHQKTARCLASGGADCEQVCLVCHPSVPGSAAVRQEWNPSGVPFAALTGDPGGGAGDDLAVCLGCHEERTGSHNHPTDVVYPRHDRGYTWVPAGPKLFCDEAQSECRIYCSTCHNPHDGGGVGLLRMNNRGSALCLACHIK